MSEPALSVSFTARMLASEACAVGNGLVYDAALGYWRVSTAANRASAGSFTEAIALTPYGGALVGSVQYQSSGVVAQEISGLPVIAPATPVLVRMSTTGVLERIALYTPGDDVVGYAESNGRVALHIGIPWQLIAAGGGVVFAGDLSGTATSQNVLKVRGAAVATAGGALVTGNALKVTGVATIDYGAVNLAGGAGHVTGSLPIANGGTGRTALGSALQVLRTNAAANATEWANVGPSQGVATQLNASDGAGGWTAATNIFAGAGYLATGLAPASIGTFRFSGGNVAHIWSAGPSGDIAILGQDPGGNIYLCTNSVGGNQSASTFIGATTAVSAQIGANQVVEFTATTTRIAQALSGLAGPYKLRSVGLAFSGADITLSAPQQECPILKCTGSAGNILAPNVADAVYIVDAGLSDRVIKKTGGTGVNCPSNKVTTVFHNGTDYKIVSQF